MKQKHSEPAGLEDLLPGIPPSDGIAEPLPTTGATPGVAGDGMTTGATPAVEVEAPKLGPIGEGERPPEIKPLC